MTPTDQYRLLVDAVRLVAASHEDQVSLLPDFVSLTDEIVLNFADACLLTAQLQKAGLVSSEAASRIKDLDSYFEVMPADKFFTETESLGTHVFWTQARIFATEILQLLHEEKRPPDLSGITWIESKRSEKG